MTPPSQHDRTSPLLEDITRVFRMADGNTVGKVLTCYRSPGVHAVTVFRFGQWLNRSGLFVRICLEPLHLILRHRVRSKWGIEIGRTATIGPGFYIGHYGGITISPSAKIGRNVNISQLVTIGAAGKGEKEGAPTIGDNVYIGPGAKLYGKITVGNNVKIGPNVVVYKDIPDNAVVVDAGFKIISYEGNGQG